MYQVYSFFNTDINGGGWSTPRPRRFTPQKETWCPLYSMFCGSQGRSGRVRKMSNSTGIWSFDRTPRRASLYCEMYSEYWPENLRIRDHLQDLDVDGRVILKCILRYCVRIWTGAICVLFWTRESTSEVFKSWINSWVGKRMLASNEEFAWGSYLMWWIRIIGNGEAAACKARNQHVAVLRTFASLILPLLT